MLPRIGLRLRIDMTHLPNILQSSSSGFFENLCCAFATRVILYELIRDVVDELLLAHGNVDSNMSYPI